MVDSKRKVHVDKMHPELWDNQGKQSVAELGQAQDKLEVQLMLELKLKLELELKLITNCPGGFYKIDG